MYLGLQQISISLSVGKNSKKYLHYQIKQQKRIDASRYTTPKANESRPETYLIGFHPQPLRERWLIKKLKVVQTRKNEVNPHFFNFATSPNTKTAKLNAS